MVTSTGSPLPKNKTVTWKGMCTVHDASAPENAELKAWFYPELSAALRPDSVEGQKYFATFLDSPRRVILEVDPTQRIGYDGTKMGRATASWIAAEAAKAGSPEGAGAGA